MEHNQTLNIQARTFPSLEMPAAQTVFKTSRNVVYPLDKKKEVKNEKFAFPRILSTSKATVIQPSEAVPKGTTFIGFQPTSVKLDINDSFINPYDGLASPNVFQPKNKFVVTTVDIDKVEIPAHSFRSPGDNRDYDAMLDTFSDHNFLIFQGKTVVETPEYQSFVRTYESEWAGIRVVIEQLEEILDYYAVRLAIVSGPKIAQLSKRNNLSSLRRRALFACIVNREEVEAQTALTFDYLHVTQEEYANAVAIIQDFFRDSSKKLRFDEFAHRIQAAIVVQSCFRMALQRIRVKVQLRDAALQTEERMSRNRERLRRFWGQLNHHAPLTASQRKKSGRPLPTRTILYIPSISAAEFVRLDYDNFKAMQNSHIAGLFQLVDVDVTLIYVCPGPMSDNEVVYHEKLLSLLGVSILPKRLYFVYPEMTSVLPPHLPLAQILWYSPQALKKIRSLIGRSRDRNGYLLPATVSWTEKKLAAYFDIPLLAGDTSICETLYSKSFIKGVFKNTGLGSKSRSGLDFEASKNAGESEDKSSGSTVHSMPTVVEESLGAQDLYEEDDLLIVLARLIASYPIVNRWIIRINYDWNYESAAYLDVMKLSVMYDIRKEKERMESGPEEYDQWSTSKERQERTERRNWYSKVNQMSVRKQLMLCLSKELPTKIRMGRPSTLGTWQLYTGIMRQYGACIYAEPAEAQYLEGVVFIDPLGDLHAPMALECYTDNHKQVQGYHTPQLAMDGEDLLIAIKSVASYLHSEYGIIGYLTIRFLCFKDTIATTPGLTTASNPGGTQKISPYHYPKPAADARTRLWGLDVLFGMTSTFGALGTAGLATTMNPLEGPVVPPSLLIRPAEGKCLSLLPYTVHPPLKKTNDEIFFQQCKMHNIAFDVPNSLGTLFFFIDSIVGGVISMLCVGDSRRASIEKMLRSLSFVGTSFGRDDEPGERSFDNLTEVLKNIKKTFSQDKHVGNDVQLHLT